MPDFGIKNFNKYTQYNDIYDFMQNAFCYDIVMFENTTHKRIIIERHENKIRLIQIKEKLFGCKSLEGFKL